MKRAALLALGLVAFACKPPTNARAPRNTLVVGLDISGSFRKSGQFDDALRYAALYIYGHINAMGGLKQTTDVFVGSLGGERVGQPKTFHPIQDLTGKTPAQIEADLRAWFPEDDPITDFNAFFTCSSAIDMHQVTYGAPAVNRSSLRKEAGWIGFS